MVSEPTTQFVPQLSGDAIAAVPELDAEKAVLLGWYGQQRAHALVILDGLDEAALRRPVLPSGWSCLGMIQHLAGMERFWFRAVVAGEPAVIADQAGAEEEWRVAPDVPVGLAGINAHQIARGDRLRGVALRVGERADPIVGRPIAGDDRRHRQVTQVGQRRGGKEGDELGGAERLEHSHARLPVADPRLLSARETVSR